MRDDLHIPYFLAEEKRDILVVGKTLKLLPEIAKTLATKRRDLPPLFLPITPKEEEELMIIFSRFFEDDGEDKNHLQTRTSHKSEGRALHLIVRRQQALIAEALREQLFGKLGLTDHFMAIKRSLLLENALIVETFLADLYSPDNFTSKVPNSLEIALAYEKALQAEPDPRLQKLLADHLSVAYHADPRKTSVESLAFEYHVPWPLNIIICSETAEKYHRITSFLVLLKTTVMVTGWQFSRRGDRTQSLLRFQIHHFVTALLVSLFLPFFPGQHTPR